MRSQIIFVLAMLLVGSCAARQKPQAPPAIERYVLPYVDPDAVFCIQQGEHEWSCIHAGDLRKLLGSMGKA